MAKNPAVKRFVWGISFFLALFVNFPILILNLPKLEKSPLAQLDVLLQIVICFIYAVVFIQVVYWGIKRGFSKQKQLWNSFVILVVFVFVLMSVNVVVIGLKVHILPTVITRGVLIAVIGYFFCKLLTETERKNEILIENEQLKHENLLVQLTSLKNQLNPHFLFNSLNTLSWLINEDKAKSQRYLQKLSQVLRYSLNMQEQSLVTLKEEFNLVDSYIFLLQMRFGDNLSVHKKIENVEQLRIPPLSIQLLIENAIKHNIISSATPLKISIELQPVEKILMVSNSLNPRPHSDSTGIGLANLNQRFKLLIGKEIEIVKNNDFTVILPLNQGL